jgi:sugar phosphate isomerase/epimerase
MKTPSIFDRVKRNSQFILVTLTAVAGCALFHPHVFKTVVGLQLYSVRDQMAKDPEGTLSIVRSWGVKYVETAGSYGMPPQKFSTMLQEHGLEAVSGHFSFDDWAKDPEAVIHQARDLGLIEAGCAWIPHGDKFDEAACRHAIYVFNQAGAIAGYHHMHFFYHTHGYEFQPYRDGTLFDLLVQETDPANVKLEMDIFWMYHAGQDPVKWLKKYPGRWELMHLKDMRRGTPTGLLTGSSDVNNDVALGTGMLNLPAILSEARSAGVQWYFIEDESPHSEDQIPQSLVYLRDLTK